MRGRLPEYKEHSGNAGYIRKKNMRKSYRSLDRLQVETFTHINP
jgi:hypothetical protein